MYAALGRLEVQQLLQPFSRSLLVQPHKQRHYWKNMECSALQPPECVRGMTKLRREAFDKVVRVPKLRVPEEKANKVLPLLKKLLLKMCQLKPVSTLVCPNAAGVSKEILLHPMPVHSWESLPTAELEQLQVKPTDFYFADLELRYTNWRADEIFKSVLPANEEGFTSYSRIGHIVHLNLRDHLLPYKQLIGDVLCDKVPGCHTVVNKVATIDNTYRNFQLELICGTPEYQVQTKENGIVFEFDFSKVYWNPRLSTEHERIVQLLQPGDVLYDVFAGVGPFSVPAAKKRCTVIANDLNPESYRWLQHNAKRNKCLLNMQLYNKDGADFICTELRADLLKRWQQNSEVTTGSIHITMNLPAMAVEFLGAFRGLFKEQKESGSLNFPVKMPLVHVYSFAKGENTQELVLTLVEHHLGMKLSKCLQGIHFVRNVAPNKDMYRVSFLLSKEILMTTKVDKTLCEKEQNSNATRKRALNELNEEKLQDGGQQCTKIQCS